MKLTEEEIQHLKKRTNTELTLSDPKAVLDDLGIWYKELGNTSYQLNVRNERTPSAYISLKNGKWNYKDFGNGNNGNIINVVMDYANLPFKEAMDYSLQKLGIPNYLSEALNQNLQTVKISDNKREELKRLREANKEREKSTAISKVVSTYEVTTNQLAVDYLKSRGIEKIPPNFKVINGEYTNKNGEVKRAYGVGILTQNGGADIHFLKKIGDLKTMTFGEKEISFFKKENSDKVAIFESKMDYAAAYQQMPIDDVNVIIANSTSNAHKVAELLQKENLTDNVMFFNQNDLSGYKFVIDVSKETNISEFKNINYDVIEEYKTDPNDLLMNDKKIADRIETSALHKFEKIYNSLEVLKNIQKDLEKPRITRDDLKHANNVNVNIDKEQSKGYER